MSPNPESAPKRIIVYDNDTKSKVKEAPDQDCCLKTVEELTDLPDNSYDSITVVLNEHCITDSLLRKLIKLLKNGSQLTVQQFAAGSTEKIEISLKTNGYVNVQINESGSTLTGSKPKYEIGSATKISLKKPATKVANNVWKIDDDDAGEEENEEEETIDPDNLLDEDDLKKPDPSTLKVCGTTGKRKACKDCSCGLADELAAEVKSGAVVDTTDAPKSSCGSCYLGDAFRCSSCPYLGMPAFRQGEKIQLSDSLLKADI